MNFAALIGRLLIIPIMLSGVCLSMLFGVPVAEAMGTDQPMMSANVSGGHRMDIVENQGQESQPVCCVTVRMEHDPEATTPSQEKPHAVSSPADIPHETVPQKFPALESTWIPPGPPSLHQQFSLIGIIFKRE